MYWLPQKTPVDCQTSSKKHLVLVATVGGPTFGLLDSFEIIRNVQSTRVRSNPMQKTKALAHAAIFSKMFSISWPILARPF